VDSMEATAEEWAGEEVLNMGIMDPITDQGKEAIRI